MKILDKETVNNIVSADKDYDAELAALVRDEPLIVIHPNLPDSVLKLVDLHDNNFPFCTKWMANGGWAVKIFPPNWNQRYQNKDIVLTPTIVSEHSYATDLKEILRNHNPKGWDLGYVHTWLFDNSLTGNSYIRALEVKYLPEATEPYVVGNINTVNDQFDIFFLSYNEPNSDQHYLKLLERFPRARRIDGVKGIYNAHKLAAEKSRTVMFYVVDADNDIALDFNFDFVPQIIDQDKIFIWQSKNSVVGIDYGYAGIKLFPKTLFEQEHTKLDVATSLGYVIVMDKIASETKFDIDPFSTWRSAFREVVKLGSGRIQNQIPEDTNLRLKFWLDPKGKSPYLSYCKEGALAGFKFLEENFSDLEKLRLINDYDWLKEKFDEYYK